MVKAKLSRRAAERSFFLAPTYKWNNTNLLNKLKADLVTMLLNLKIVQKEEENSPEDIIKENLKSVANKKIGRNEPCPCKSGKKFKHCHGAI